MSLSRTLRSVLGIMMAMLVLMTSFPAAAAENDLFDEVDEVLSVLSAVNERAAKQFSHVLAAILSEGSADDIESVMMMLQMLRAQLLDAQVKRQAEEIQNINKEIAWRQDMLAKLQSLQRFASRSSRGIQVFSAETLTNRFGFTDQQLQELMRFSGRSQLLVEQIDELVKQIRADLTQIGNTQHVLAVRFDHFLNNYADGLSIMQSHMQRLQDAISSIIATIPDRMR